MNILIKSGKKNLNLNLNNYFKIQKNLEINLDFLFYQIL